MMSTSRIQRAVNLRLKMSLAVIIERTAILCQQAQSVKGFPEFSVDLFVPSFRSE